MMRCPSFVTRWVKSLQSFWFCDNGAMVPLMALSMIAVVGLTGIAVDTARAQLVQSRLQFSLDAAGLAAGATTNTQKIQTEAIKYLNANFNGYLGAELNATAASVKNNVITISASASLPTSFMAVVNVKTIHVNASSDINMPTSGMEVVLVLDNTGSMSNDGKLDALKSAATTMVNSLFGDSDTLPNLYVGVVPFSQAVNIGTSHPTWIDNNYLPGNGNTWPAKVSWAGCVTARYSGNEDIADDVPASGDPATLFWQYFNYCPSGYKWNDTATNTNATCQARCSYGYTWDGASSSCICPSGFHKIGPWCVYNCGNGYSWNGSSCSCNASNYINEDGACVPHCGNYNITHMYWSGSACLCGSGYTLKGGVCVVMTPQ